VTSDAKPRIGLLGIMQELYDDMIPGITERQAQYARSVAESLAGVAEVTFSRPARNRADVEAIMRELQAQDLDGIMIVMLTYGPAMRTVRALEDCRVPLLLANIQPERTITAAWDMADLTYNQGIHGAQDQANALLRSGLPCSIITGDWRSERFAAAFADWARAAQTVTRLRRARIALLGYPMNQMGDILYDPAAMARRLGPMVVSEDLGRLVARIEAVSDSEVQELLAAHRARFAVADDLPRERHAYAARMELAIRGMLADGGYEGFSFHFDSIGGDGRFQQLPLLAASDLMADGYGFAAEGDTNTAALMIAAQALIEPGWAHFSEMYAMDWERDSILISHMGEGNWRIAREDRPVRLIDRPLGIGRLDNPPTPVFSAVPGPCTTAALVAIEGEHFRLVVGRGEVLDTPELPKVEMHYFHVRPEIGMEPFMDAWLTAGAPHHFVTNLGDHTARWRRLAELLDLELVELF
jgi:L-arabinose isomerase